MQIPKILIKIYHKMPLPKRVKKILRRIFYSILIPFIKFKRLFFVDKKINLSDLQEIKSFKNLIGFCECQSNLIEKSFFILYPSMFFVKNLFEEILKDNVYLKYLKIEKGDVVVDVGANIGIFSVLASLLVGNNGLVLCCEPDPQNIEFLYLNKKINKLNNIEIIEKAIWGKKENLHFYVNDLNSAASGIYSGHSKKIKIESDYLDNMLDKFINEKKEIFLKMDIEGAEIEAFKGMKKLLKYPKLKGVIAAYHKIPKNDNHLETIKTHTLIEPILKENNFEVINENGFLYFWR